ncbi:ABC transporter permease [Aeromicrobium panaciterrae]|uniref:ABC transporter permease n=1 Tax=Aeromicrobium panaciterrae TaxID=363861 RepID=UPI0031CDED88
MKRLALRFGQAALVVWGAFTVSFVILYLIPGDSVSVLLGADGGTAVSPEQEAALRSSLGLDQGFFERYVHLAWQYLHLDFGNSVLYGARVTDLLKNALPSTIVLTLSAMVLSIVFGIAFAVAISFRPDGRIARTLRILPAFGNAVPTFWIALILLQVFSFQIHIFPSSGDAQWYSVVLPALTIAIPYGSMIAQVTLDGILRARAELYVTTAVSKGLRPLDVHTRHVLPASLLPTVSIIGLHFGTLLAGAVISETVYSRQGIGSLMQQAVVQRDLPLVQGTIVTTAIVFVIVNLLTDAVYPLIDPRAKVSS